MWYYVSVWSIDSFTMSDVLAIVLHTMNCLYGVCMLCVAKSVSAYRCIQVYTH